MAGHLKKNGKDYSFWSRDHISGSIFMFDVILGSGRQKSILRSIFVHFKTIFPTNKKNGRIRGGHQG